MIISIEKNIKKCNLYFGSGFEHFETAPSKEWDAVKATEKKDKSIYLKIPNTSTYVKFKAFGLIITNPQLNDKITTQFYNDFFSDLFDGRFG